MTIVYRHTNLNHGRCFCVEFRYYACGPWAGKLFCLVVVVNFIVWRFLEWQQVHFRFAPFATDFERNRYASEMDEFDFEDK